MRIQPPNPADFAWFQRNDQRRERKQKTEIEQVEKKSQSYKDNAWTVTYDETVGVHLDIWV